MTLKKFKRKFFKYIILDAKRRSSTSFNGTEVHLVALVMKPDLDETEFMSFIKNLQVKEFIVPHFSQDFLLENFELTDKGLHYYDNKIEFWKQFALSKISDIVVSTITAIIISLITNYVLHIT